jgi:hypothetical protein
MPGNEEPKLPDPPEGEEVPSLAQYFGGYALIFFGVIGFALLMVLLMKVLR